MRHGFIKTATATPSIRVADCKYNADQILTLVRRAHEEGIHLLVLPELCITGYTCQDLFLQQTLLESAQENAIRVASKVPRNMVVVFGAPVEHRGKLHNCAIVASAGKILGIVPKINIPNYLEFYEQRWFTPALPNEELVEFGDQKVYMGGKLIFTCNQLPYFRLACEVCEDLWVPNPPSVNHAINGATVIANISASDEFTGKATYRMNLVEGQSARLICAYLYANAGEGESSTDLVFTGNNQISENGITLGYSSMKTDELLVSEIDLEHLEHERRLRNTFVTTNDKDYRYIGFDIEVGETSLTRRVDRMPFVPSDNDARDKRSDEIITLQCLGLKQRLRHTNCKTAVVGISGGLDSTLALIVTVRTFDMLGLDRKGIIAVTMPCFGTTVRTKTNAMDMIERLGCTLKVVDIKQSVMQHFADIGQDPDTYDVTYENSQARERTQILMDIANKCNGMVVGTGDLSELALGWATYNGDHMSMYGVNAGVPKTLVKHLVGYYARHISDTELAATLDSVIDTPISPELIPGKQETEDLVGPYELHDFFIYHVLRWGSSPSKVYRLARYAFQGSYDDATILKWLRTFYRRFFAQQFKRSCLPDGPKVGSVALSPRGDWRMPSDACVRVWQNELESSLE
ncbi:MAG: NAD(+) synthase [Sphaerochaetaceae bacterium]|nr:NAD(+) synthase [Sphaerochaetaceae bacterium]